ncbi:DUF6912 family protein [Arcanobacterium canis]
MRIYVPLIPEELAAPEISPRLVHAVTPDLVRVLGTQDEEEREYVAFLAAADDSLRSDSPTPRRVVVCADMPHASVELPNAEEQLLETAVYLIDALTWDRVESIHIDEDEASELIAAARGGDDAAFEASVDTDLLWYDVVERDALIAMMSTSSFGAE